MTAEWYILTVGPFRIKLYRWCGCVQGAPYADGTQPLYFSINEKAKAVEAFFDRWRPEAHPEGPHYMGVHIGGNHVVRVF